MQVGKYQLIRQLAVGGMAEVFLARASGPMGFEKQLVLKRVLPHLAVDPSFVQMFLGEATLAARLTHPNIVQTLDFGQSDGGWYLAMEYMDGPSLRALLDDALKRGSPLPPAICARIISAACEGLAFAHDFKDPTTGQPLNIVHRDISPDNLLLSRQGAVKVADFGIAKAAGQQHRTQTGMIKGKLAYMPPEQIRNQQLDRQVDVYALGVVLYELLTGQRPFQADTDVSLMHAVLYETPKPASQLQPTLPEPMLRIIERATAKERQDRYPDCLAFQAALEEYLLSTGKPVTTGHLAQFIAEISPPGPEAPPIPLLPPSNVPLTDTALRPAANPVEDAPGQLLIPDTLISPAAKEPPLPAGVELSPSFIEEKKAVDAAQASAPAGVAPSAAPTRRGDKRRAAILAGVVLVAGGFYLSSQRTSPPPSAITPPTAPPVVSAPPAPPAAPVTEPAPAPEVPAPPAAPIPEAPANPDVKTGTLEIEVRPWAIVYLQGKKLAKVQSQASVDINPGTYTLRFVNAKLGKSLERPVEVKAGRTTFVLVDMLNDEEEAPKP